MCAMVHTHSYRGMSKLIIAAESTRLGGVLPRAPSAARLVAALRMRTLRWSLESTAVLGYRLIPVSQLEDQDQAEPRQRTVLVACSCLAYLRSQTFPFRDLLSRHLYGACGSYVPAQ